MQHIHINTDPQAANTNQSLRQKGLSLAKLNREEAFHISADVCSLMCGRKLYLGAQPLD